MNKKVKIIISTLLTLIFVYYIASQIEWQQLTGIINKADYKLVFIAVLLYFISYIIRALRLKVIVNDKHITVKKLLSITLLHNLYNRILPARLGDFSLIYMLKHYANKNVSLSIGLFLILRIYDLMMSLIFLSISYNIIFPFGLISLVLWVFVFIFLCFAIQPIKLIKIVYWIMEKVPLNIRIFDIIKQKLTIIIVGTKQLEKISIRIYLFASTFAIWSLIIILFVCLLQSISINFKLLDTIFATALANFSWVLPINGLGGFGTMEASWGYAFSLRGYDFNSVIIYALYINVIVFISTVIFAVVPYIINIQKREELAHEVNNSDSMS